MRIKFNSTFNSKKILKSIILVFVSALLIATTLIALPLTEKVSENLSFNLNTKDSKYWSKEYIVRIDTKEEDEIKKVKEVFYKRLRDFGVENVSIAIGQTDEESTNLRIVVNTTKDEISVIQLIANRYDYSIVTRKVDVDFEDEENPYAIVLDENYDRTEFDYSDFREIHIPKQKLRTSQGDYRYFAIFKQWPNKVSELNEFLIEKQGENIGVSIDGFVTPYSVPILQEGARKMDSITLGINAESEAEAEVMKLLYNSGHIPVAYTLEEQNEQEPKNIKVDYIKVMLGLGISLIATYILLYIFKYDTRRNLVKSFLATIFALTIYLTYIKLTHIPVDTFLLTISAILTIILIRALVSNRDSEIYIMIGAFAILVTINILGTGLMSVLAVEMIALIAISKLSLLITGWYIDNVKELL